MGDAIRAFEWAGTSLGPIEGWPESLLNTLRTILATRQPICFWWGPDLLQFHNDAYLPVIAERADEALGAPFQRFWADVWDGVRPFVDEAFAGRGTWIEDLPLQMVRGGKTVPTSWTFSYSPLYDDEGEIAGVMNIVTETTQAVRNREALASEIDRTKAALESLRVSEKRQRVLQRELTHRMKNTLAMVQSVVTQSLRHSDDVETGAKLAAQRIEALSRAQDMLTETTWETADIREVVEAAIAPHLDDTGRIRLDGPEHALTAQQALGLSLAIHELATNAVKYGALSNERGSVRIAWSDAENGGLVFCWSEHDGPPVIVPEKKGFGTKLTTRVVPFYFDGRASMDYAGSGIVYSLFGSPPEGERSGVKSPSPR
ncbi:sensor histidine kinase [Aurantimonas sp. VKM B-3413]|uniref:sensor histidine kinase n=1 Tax=Aurantimonas sp. VKM B-3413 TaxID=2779401 RepID=UPI001E2833BE|nr:PAS domain-containing sensor histidine kinase [Aurantimonas sp. VKM B-3413]MCB8840519.1 PAS domain-containing protein [Aurantimonas sp. VKM B-3413]